MFDAESVVRGDTRLKVAPPLRTAANRRKLWTALLDGSIKLLASDHTPATLEERAGSFFDAFTGISGLQFTLPATWTEAREHGATLRNLSQWLSVEPAKLAGIWQQKGSLEPGKDADLIVWRPDARTETAAVYHRQPGSPYEVRAPRSGAERHPLRDGLNLHSNTNTNTPLLLLPCARPGASALLSPTRRPYP